MQHCSLQNFVQAVQPLSHLRLDKSDTDEDRKCISIVKTMLDKCKEEKCLNCLQVPLDDHVQRVAYYTGLPSTYLAYLATDYAPRMPPKVVDLIVILKCLQVEYANQKYPSLNKLFAEVLIFRQNKNMQSIDYDQFCHQMISLHFWERPTKNNKYLLMEDPKITFERYNYLNTLEKYKNKGIAIYYLDERILAKSDSLNELNVMLFYAVQMNTGYVRGLYCNSPDKDVYMKWITDILLPLLIPSSLIIISDGPFNETADTNITRYHSKAEMLKWLTAKNIPCSDNMHKAELYELISKCSSKCEQSNLECVLKAHGYKVLLRPATLKDCSPTEAFWNDLYSELSLEKAKIYDPMLQGKIETYIKSLSQLQWVLYEESIGKREKLLLTVDQQIQEALENYELDTVACENISVGVN